MSKKLLQLCGFVMDFKSKKRSGVGWYGYMKILTNQCRLPEVCMLTSGPNHIKI